MRNPETAIMVAIQDALAASGKCLIWRNPVGGAHTKGGAFVKYGLGIGSPDLVGVHIPTGRFVGCEVKTEAGRLSAAQKAWHRAAKEAGALVFCARTPEEALSYL